jgi:Flp pilus assembly protein TadG
MSETRFLSQVMSLIRRFRRDSRGNMAITFGIATIPILSAIGCAVDYSLATRIKAKLQSAADAASVVAISQNSPGYAAAVLMTADGSIAPGLADAKNIFNGNVSNFSNSFSNLNLTGTTVTKTGSKLNSTVTFSADVPVTFMQVVGFKKLTVSGTSVATVSLPLYLDFYLMIDVSGSMGLPSTNAEQTRLASINPDDFSVYPNGCTFACHFQANACSNPSVGQKAQASPPGPVNSAYPTNNYCLGFLISRVSQSGYAGLLQNSTNYPMKGKEFPSQILNNLNSNVTPGAPNSLLTGNSASLSNSLTPVTSCPTAGTDACIQLRADAVGVALNATKSANGVDGLFATANAKETVASQFRIGLYPFIRFLYSTYSPLTSSINGSPTSSGTINYNAANLAALLDTGNNPNIANLGSGGTHFENAFPSMNTLITNVGDGSASNNTKPFVFLITDGAQDPQTQSGGSWAGSNNATVMPTGSASYCKPLKDRGITISVLYIPYATIQNPTTIFNSEDIAANNNIPNIPASLQDCASPNFFFTANTPADITTALNAMFNQALVTAHLTN